MASERGLRDVRALYLCYFGIDEPLVQTQVLPYLRELSAAGVALTLLTFEPISDAAWRRTVAPAWMAKLAASGIAWEWLPYHKRPTIPATAYDIVRGAWRARRLARARAITVIHARSHVAAAMGALANCVVGAKLIFDVRGMLAEEYVEGGVWPEGGYLYRSTKRIERALFAAADGFVVLTERGRCLLFSGTGDRDATGRPIEVIPCCVDLDRFTRPDAAARAAAKARLGLAGRRVIAHVGALDGWVLTDATGAFLAAACARDPNTVALILTRSPAEGLEAALARHGLAPDRYLLKAVPADAVPAHLHAVDIGVALYKSGGAKICSSPTKIAEYLASGIPVLTTPGMGDVEDVIVADRIGVITTGTDAAAIERAWTSTEALETDPAIADRCRRSAVARFDLRSVGGHGYRRLYARVLESGV